MEKNISECIRFQSNSNDYIFIYVFINIIGAGWEFQSLFGEGSYGSDTNCTKRRKIC